MSKEDQDNEFNPWMLTLLPVVIGKMLLLDPFLKVGGYTYGKILKLQWHNYYNKIQKLQDQSKFEEAILLAKKTLKFTEKKFAINHPAHLGILLQLANSYLGLSKTKEAGEIIDQYEECSKNIFGEDEMLEYEALFTKAAYERETQKLDKAITSYISVIDKLKNRQQLDSDLYYGAYYEVAEVFILKGEFDNALKTILLCREYWNQHKSTFDEFLVLTEKAKLDYCEARIFQGKGDLDQSIICYELVMKFYKKYSNDILNYADILLDYISLLFQLNNLEEAGSHLKFIKEIYDKEKWTNYSIDHYEAVLLFRSGELEKSLDKLLRVYKEIFPNLHLLHYEFEELSIIAKIALIYSELDNPTKSIKFLKLLNNHIVDTFQNTISNLNEYERYYFLKNLYDTISTIYSVAGKYMNLGSEYVSELYKFRLIIKSVNENIDIAFIPTFVSLQKSLKKDEAIVDIVAYESYPDNKKTITSLAFIITGETELAPYLILRSLEPKILEEQYLSYTKLLRRKAVDIKSYSFYWDTIDQFVIEKRKIFVTPDSFYRFINISNMQMPDGKYYFENKLVRIFENFSPTKTAEPIDNQGVACIFANANFALSEKPTAEELLPEHLQSRQIPEVNDIPFTESEGNKVAEILEQDDYSVQKYYGEKFNKTNIIGIQNTKVIHFATHGFNFSGELTTTNIHDWDQSTGLILSGAYIKDEQGTVTYYNNGFLFSKDIKKLDLSSTELVVLSACSSGRDVFTNTGDIFGLQKAFITAGVKNLLVALWEIDDKITEEFMIVFYKNYVQHEDCDQALEAAKLEIKGKYIHPLYWAGFMVIHNSLQTVMGKENV